MCRHLSRCPSLIILHMDLAWAVRKPRHLWQRVSKVILLDRPCSALDPVSTAKIEESLKQLKEQFTIIIAPHNVQQAGRIADRVAFMLMGSLIEQGATAEVFENPQDKRTSDYITGRFG